MRCRPALLGVPHFWPVLPEVGIIRTAMPPASVLSDPDIPILKAAKAEYAKLQ
jgi:hypothetical protein